MRLRDLSEEEARVIESKGTEPPRSGEYDQFDKEGMFTCRRCGAYLYRSDDKFESRCGWPSFDAEILGAVERILDPDGRRTEIICRRCQGHLGHVFVGEQLTVKNTRHCVNSVSLLFVPKKSRREHGDEEYERAYFGTGCFWCSEASFRMLRGVISVTPGYAGGSTGNPTYETVSTGTTGHAEVVRVEFDPRRISYEALLDMFFLSHDPTTPDRQGNDVGTQYRSIVLYEQDIHREIAEAAIQRLAKDHVFGAAIVTEVKALERFYEAEEYHHRYFEKNPAEGYCRAVVAPKLSHLASSLASYMK